MCQILLFRLEGIESEQEQAVLNIFLSGLRNLESMLKHFG
jgi:hypothetical protein